jgi:tRNA pseudouridine38-40 synthase
LQNTIKKINYIKIKYKKNVLIIRISADGFLRSMVRMIVGTLLDINENKKNISDIEKLLIHNVKGSCITKARACGLYLLEVKY